MQYDVLIIGGGISGLTAGIKCAGSGLKTAIYTTGMSALHFSSGSIDLYSYSENEDNDLRAAGLNPFREIEKLIREKPEHPYSKCGLSFIREALDFFTEESEKEKLFFVNNKEQNHFHITAMGGIKASYLSQSSVYNEKIKEALLKKDKTAILNFEGYRDFYPELAISNLKKNPLFRGMDFISGEIKLPPKIKKKINPFEFRSADVARTLDDPGYVKYVAGRIKELAGDASVVGIPAFICMKNFDRNHKILEKISGKIIYEVPSLPPSILGMRIDYALKNRFAALGGTFIPGDSIISGKFEDAVLKEVYTKNQKQSGIQAKHFILASGSFFSGGLRSEYDTMEEPVFNLQIDYNEYLNKRSAKSFFDKESHAFLSFGVKTDKDLHPFARDGRKIENLFCSGAILNAYNPIKEGCGGGVAISTGYKAALQIIEEQKK